MESSTPSDNSTQKISNFEKFAQDAFSVIKNGIKTASSFPTAENYNYYTCYSTFNNLKNEEAEKITTMMQTIIKTTGVNGNMNQRDVDEKFELLLEANDILIDRAENCLDIEEGITRNSDVELIVSQTISQSRSRVESQILNGSWNKVSSTSKQNDSNLDQNKAIRLLAAKNIQRPQLTFSEKVDNSSKPWKPKLKSKPNALKPLNLYADAETGQFCNPYEYELNNFNIPEHQLIKKKPIKYKNLESTPLIQIDKESSLHDMIKNLKKESEIAVDLEHHSYRSFLGITCLIQLSTRDKDYIIDALSLRSEMHLLNEIFTHPSILKVFHGADSDVEWLQRDFSVYVVNMFDTHQAAKQLNLPFLSLAYLLRTYCNIDPNKHFQLADWRMRPLPDELLKYAREDTHYLLYIKDILRNLLLDMDNGKDNILKVVYSCSTDLCKKTYVKPTWTEESYMNIYRKSQKMFNNRQLYALKELHKWRDQIARQEDDSTNYVLPNHMMLNIAENLPREMQGVLACCNPIPPLIRQNLLKIHKLILKSREQPLVKSIQESEIRQRTTQRSQIQDSESWIFMPHDIPSNIEVANLLCLLDDNNKSVVNFDFPKLKHLTVFESSSEDESTYFNEVMKKKRKVAFISPYKRYRLVIPMVIEEERKEKEKIEEERKANEEKIMNTNNNKNKILKSDKQQSINRVRDHFQTVASISRVRDHFLTVAQSTPQNVITNKRPASNPADVIPNNSKTLSQMRGKKRKRPLKS